tara:strand:- start:891 stop:1088 length:198 start_codon:yes stop_codon:yes gene_type:complete
MKKYKQNLRVENGKVYSYNTLVARINRGQTHLTLVDWNIEGKTTSPTTSKHINYVARELNLKLIK